ncbi:MAG: DUF167 domain-containing protein [Nanoarchaeota archaeon]|nr:DUF167 domain-containing protein [Nanoarchaeota archaeon]
MRLNINVQPNSGRQEIKKISDSEYKIFLKKSPEDNKANEELTKLLKKEFNKEAKIIKGFISKNKVVEI